ncbi:MAG: RibD family protein, partial [Solirubrobacterales bacterium]
EGGVATDARLLNQPFRKLARTGRPWVVLKSALTLDGRTATAAGDSKWISGDASRQLVHRLRSDFDAVAVGIVTAIADDALLTSRGVDAARQPTRVVFDSRARVPIESALVRTATEASVLVIAGPDAPRPNVDALTNAGAEVVICGGEGADRVRAALQELGRRDIAALMVEGGATLAGSFREAGELDELRLFFAPMLLGGSESRPLLGGRGPDEIAGAERALAVEWEPVSGDMLARVRMREW